MISMSNAAASNTAYLEKLSNSPYFVSRLNEAQLAYEREMAAAEATAEAAAEATLKAEQKTLERDERAIQKFLRKLSPEEVAEAFEVPLDQVNRIAIKAKIY